MVDRDGDEVNGRDAARGVLDDDATGRIAIRLKVAVSTAIMFIIVVR